MFLVPLAIFRGARLPRRESRLATLLYSVQEAPGEAKRLFTYLWNAEADAARRSGARSRSPRSSRSTGARARSASSRRLARALQIFLYREERVVLGADAAAARAMVREHRAARRRAGPPHAPHRRRARRAARGRWSQEARGYFDEMAANFNGLYFGILEFVFNRIWPRVFSGLEIIGLERVVECVKEHPVVLVPCHRSHFDYLILSYIFHENYLSPPHIAAGDQPELLADGAALPRRRRVLHPPHASTTTSSTRWSSGSTSRS